MRARPIALVVFLCAVLVAVMAAVPVRAGLFPVGSVTGGVKAGIRAASCPGAISWQRAASAIGRTATIVGRVAGTRYAASSNGSPTFLNLGVNYPNPRRFTVVIRSEKRSAFGRPESRYRGRIICVRGAVYSYDGPPADRGAGRQPDQGYRVTR